MNTLRTVPWWLIVVIGLVLIPPVVSAQVAEEKFRIGTFDSRCVAIAYGRSAAFAEYLKGLHADHAQAKEAGNEARVKELGRIGAVSQVLMHQQGFSTGSVRSIMETIAGRLSAIAQQKRVMVVMSKWELFHHDGQVELVDVTAEVVGLFNPDAQTLEILAQIRKSDPVPIEQISLDPRD